MNRLEALSLVEVKGSQISNLESKREGIEQERDQKIVDLLKVALEKYNCLENGVTISDRFSSTQITLSAIRPEEKWFSDLISINLSESYGRERNTIRGLSPSFYTTSEKSLFELQRMVLIGKVGQMLIDCQYNLVKNINTIREAYRAELAGLTKQIYELEKERNELAKLADNLKLEELTEMIKDGVKLEEGYFYLPLRANEKIAVKYFKILSTSTSGKTATIEYMPFRSDRIIEESIKTQKVKDFLVHNKRNLSNIQDQKLNITL